MDGHGRLELRLLKTIVRIEDASAIDTPPSITRRGLLRVLAYGASAAIGGWSLGASASGATVGRPAPELLLHTLDGQNISTQSLHGQVVILTFWATWCAPCKEELLILSDYAARNAARGLRVLGFCLDEADKLPEVRRIASQLSFPVGLLGSAWAGAYGRIWRLPANFTINRAGILVDNAWSEDDPAWTAARLERVVTPLLDR